MGHRRDIGLKCIWYGRREHREGHRREIGAHGRALVQIGH